MKFEFQTQQDFNSCYRKTTTYTETHYNQHSQQRQKVITADAMVNMLVKRRLKRHNKQKDK